ncbi:MAG: glycoside hydrolase family 2 TIM barrel-domain containing protein [Mariniphaga sp.]|nr:glycoside hydrolase family 2 TIM barrel-domain containing protein [Mariniphaga sp.]
MKIKLLIFPVLLAFFSCQQHETFRNLIRLDGEWEITKTNSYTYVPSAFTSQVPVPGLVDLANPALDTTRDYEQGVYWYKTRFTVDQNYPEVVRLKVGKSKYHSKVIINDKLVGDQYYNFTAACFDIKNFLNAPGEENEIIIGVGTVKELPDTIVWGHDFEKLTYIPGIYDHVDIILSGYPYIQNIQTVPMIQEEKVRIVADLDLGEQTEAIRLSYEICELGTGKKIASGESTTNDFSVQIPNCQLWSPENPFLYELTLSTGSDHQVVRFGMRSFSFDVETGRAMLNGKPYFMRGTNVTIGRFFEDPDRSLLPWNKDWVTQVHKRFKEMNWNSIRYCIGLPPDIWYDIADSLGFLIQNEYPVWTGGHEGFDQIYPGVTTERLANEYRTWMREHWNHPCVVIWDAQNESVSKTIGEAINQVRDLDLSNRPWENGWSAPQSDSDPIESHPYLFGRYRRGGEPSSKGPMADFFTDHIQVPLNDPHGWDPPRDNDRYPNPIIINEYAWLWLNRDGSPTTLTDHVYEVAFGENLTVDQRRYAYTRHLGMLTEYWRANRMCAGVLHFCGLGYSRPEEPRGQTSDNFIDIKNLTYDPLFVKYVKPAFNPVGIMIDFWHKTFQPNVHTGIEVYVINDLENIWNGQLKLSLYHNNEEVKTLIKNVTLPAWDRSVETFMLKMPQEKGEYSMEAEIEYNGEPVKSIREFVIE